MALDVSNLSFLSILRNLVTGDDSANVQNLSDTAILRLLVTEVAGALALKVSGLGAISVDALPAASASLKGRIYYLTTDNVFYKVDDAGTGWTALTGAAAAAWGAISGTLANQTDLKNALDLKANTASLGTAAAADVTDFDLAGAAAGLVAALSALCLKIANDLSDLHDVPTARLNLGLGTAAESDAGDFDAAGAAEAVLGTSAQKASNLSDLADAATARTNLGLGTAATQTLVVNGAAQNANIPTLAMTHGAKHFASSYANLKAIDGAGLTAGDFSYFYDSTDGSWGLYYVTARPTTQYVNPVSMGGIDIGSRFFFAVPATNPGGKVHELIRGWDGTNKILYEPELLDFTSAAAIYYPFWKAWRSSTTTIFRVCVSNVAAGTMYSQQTESAFSYGARTTGEIFTFTTSPNIPNANASNKALAYGQREGRTFTWTGTVGAGTNQTVILGFPAEAGSLIHAELIDLAQDLAGDNVVMEPYVAGAGLTPTGLDLTINAGAKQAAASVAPATAGYLHTNAQTFGFNIAVGASATGTLSFKVAISESGDA